MITATTIANAYLPSSIQKIDGCFWLMFHNDGTFAEYKAMPNALKYDDKTFIKAGWNSDTHTVHYKQGVPAIGV
jgi:hypothetical protein